MNDEKQKRKIIGCSYAPDLSTKTNHHPSLSASSSVVVLIPHLRVVGAAPLHGYGSNDATGRRSRVLLGTITILDSASVPTGQWHLLSLKRCGCAGRGAGGEVPGGGWEEAAGWHSVGRAANGAEYQSSSNSSQSVTPSYRTPDSGAHEKRFSLRDLRACAPP